jgi:purine-binding chemotaxis protein CheW
MDWENSLWGGEQHRQFLSFLLDGEVFALDVSKVREILDRTDLTRIPRMPRYMRGALNLRGAVVPVIDLRVKFGLEPAEVTLDTCVIVIEVVVDGETSVIGGLVDAVDEVFELPEDRLEPAPRMGARLDAEFIEAMGRRDDDFVIILDADRVFSVDEVIEIRSSVSDATTNDEETTAEAADV